MLKLFPLDIKTQETFFIYMYFYAYYVHVYKQVCHPFKNGTRNSYCFDAIAFLLQIKACKGIVMPVHVLSSLIVNNMYN